MNENEIDKYQEAYRAAEVNIKDPTDAQKTALKYGEFLEKPVENIILFNPQNKKNMKSMMNRFFKECINKTEFKDYKFIISVKKIKQKELLTKKFKNIDAVLENEENYKQILATAKIIISDKKLPYYFVTRKEQIYIRMFDESFYEEEQEYFTKDNIDQHRMILKDLLNATYILSRNEKMTKEYLIDNYQLRSIYSGKILETGKIEADQFLEILKEISQGGEKLKNVVNCKDNKKKILIYADYKLSRWWQGRIRRILDNIDYNKYDITLISQVVRDPSGMKALQTLNKNVRILMRSGHLNATREDYLKYHCITQSHLELNNYDKLIQDISQNVIDNEWGRMFGKTSFDRVIICDAMLQGQIGLWHVLALRSDIPQKYIIANTNFRSELNKANTNESHENKMLNYIKVCEKYDKLYLISKDEVDYVRGNLKINTKLDVLKDHMPKDFVTTKKVNHCYYQKEKFFVLNQQGTDENLTVTIVKEPETTDHNCISNITNYSETCFDDMLTKFIKIKGNKTNAKLYLLDNIRYVSNDIYNKLEDRNLKDDVFVICGIDLTDQYLKQFNQYIIYDAQNPEEDIYLTEAKKLIPICN